MSSGFPASSGSVLFWSGLVLNMAGGGFAGFLDNLQSSRWIFSLPSSRALDFSVTVAVDVDESWTFVSAFLTS